MLVNLLAKESCHHPFNLNCLVKKGVGSYSPLFFFFFFLFIDIKWDMVLFSVGASGIVMFFSFPSDSSPFENVAFGLLSGWVHRWSW